MLKDLLVVTRYFDATDSAMYEEDLVRRYGREEVTQAIRAGWLSHGWIPGGCGRRRCVVRLSEAGMQAARA